jgi:allantoinase
VLVLRSARVVLPDGVRPASLHVSGGTITHVAGYDEAPSGAEALHDVGDLVISPGIVDVHVHVNEPGRTDWEGFETATRAAAAGGVTTIVDMPLNSVPATTTVEALEAKRSAARGRCHVDVAFWGGVVPGNASALEALVDAGVRGFKCFLVSSGVDEFPPVRERDLREAMPILARRGVPLLVHAESPDVIARSRSPEGSRSNPCARLQPTVSDRSSESVERAVYKNYVATRPPEAEVEAIRMMVRLAREFGTHVHIVHVAAAEAVDEIAQAQADGVGITAETCPHYLSFAAEEIPDGATEFKCAPPVREARHRDALWDALGRGTLALVASDHSPAPPALKCPGDFMRAWGGVASLELSLAATWTGLAARPGHARDDRDHLAPTFAPCNPLPPLARLATWMSAAPAALAHLHRKGRIAVGCDADVVIWDPGQTRLVDPLALQQRHKLTPYAGRCLRGVVRATFLRGQPVWDDGRLTCPASGHLL